MVKHNICHIDRKNLCVPNFDYEFFKTANKINKTLKVSKSPEVLVLDHIN